MQLLRRSSLTAAGLVGCQETVTYVNTVTLYMCEELIDFCFDTQTHPKMKFLVIFFISSRHSFCIADFFPPRIPVSFCSVFLHQLSLMTRR